METLGLGLNRGLELQIGGIERVAHLLQTAEHLTVTGIDHVAHPVAHPVGIVGTEVQRIGSRGVLTTRSCRGAAVDGSESHHVGIIVAKPQHTANLTGQPGTHLTHINKA